jgi:hypothetical protein
MGNGMFKLISGLILIAFATNVMGQKDTVNVSKHFVFPQPYSGVEMLGEKILDQIDSTYMKQWVIVDKNDAKKVRALINQRRKRDCTSFTELHSNGCFKSIKLYQDGKLSSSYFEYHPNELIKVWGQYKKGNKVSNWIYFNEEGFAIKREKYNGKGVLKSTKPFKKENQKMYNKERAKKEGRVYSFEPIPPKPKKGAHK